MTHRVLAAGLLALTTVLVAPPASAQQPFTVTRVELVFANGRGEITVPLRYPDVRVFGLLRFSGIGVAQGSWKVDGRIVAPIAEPTVFGEDLIVATPALPALEAGQHRVTLELTHPQPTFKIPEVSYFVTNEDYEAFRKRMETPK
jgi:hypothetical protein